LGRLDLGPRLAPGRRAQRRAIARPGRVLRRVHAVRLQESAHPPLQPQGRPMSVDFYGIPNCDTVKKARAWLDAKGSGYAFHDYKKEGADPARLARWAADKGWETLLH